MRIARGHCWRSKIVARHSNSGQLLLSLGIARQKSRNCLEEEEKSCVATTTSAKPKLWEFFLLLWNVMAHPTPLLPEAIKSDDGGQWQHFLHCFAKIIESTSLTISCMYILICYYLNIVVCIHFKATAMLLNKDIFFQIRRTHISRILFVVHQVKSQIVADSRKVQGLLRASSYWPNTVV